MQVADKLNQKYSFITMNLAAAKVALDITGHDPQKYSNIVIQLGVIYIIYSLGMLKPFFSKTGNRLFKTGLKPVIVCPNHSPNHLFVYNIYIYILSIYSIAHLS